MVWSCEIKHKGCFVCAFMLFPYCVSQYLLPWETFSPPPAHCVSGGGVQHCAHRAGQELCQKYPLKNFALFLWEDDPNASGEASEQSWSRTCLNLSLGSPVLPHHLTLPLAHPQFSFLPCSSPILSLLRSSEGMWMWCLVLWPNGELGSARLKVGPLKVFSNLNDSRML